MNKSAFELSCKFPLVNSAKAKWQEVARQLMTIKPVLDAQVDQRGILNIRYDASTIGLHDDRDPARRAGHAAQNKCLVEIEIGLVQICG